MYVGIYPYICGQHADFLSFVPLKLPITVNWSPWNVYLWFAVQIFHCVFWTKLINIYIKLIILNEIKQRNLNEFNFQKWNYGLRIYNQDLYGKWRLQVEQKARDVYFFQSAYSSHPLPLLVLLLFITNLTWAWLPQKNVRKDTHIFPHACSSLQSHNFGLCSTGWDYM